MSSFLSGLPLPLAAFIAGLISFLSPCVLPLVPGYVSLISGAGVEELKARQGQLMQRVMVNSVGFILGFSVVFITLGAISTEIGQMAARYKHTLSIVAGVVIIIFGLHLTGIFKIKALYTDARLHSVKGSSTPIGAFVIGFAFAFGWTPCLGPILTVLLTLASEQDTLSQRDFAARRLFAGAGGAVSADLAADGALPEVLQPLPLAYARAGSGLGRLDDRARGVAGARAVHPDFELVIVFEPVCFVVWRVRL
jgi:cytochrome c-type biogenesis protein